MQDYQVHRINHHMNCKLTDDQLTAIIDHLRWYLPYFHERNYPREDSTPWHAFLKKDAHRAAHPIMLALRRESRKVPLDIDEVRRLFQNLYDVVGDYLIKRKNRERDIFRKFLKLRRRS